MQRYLYIAIALLLQLVLLGQGAITLTLDRDTFGIGDDVRVRVDLRLPKNVNGAVLDFGRWDTIPNLAFNEQLPGMDRYLDYELENNGAWKVDPKRPTDLRGTKAQVAGQNNTYSTIVDMKVYSVGAFVLPMPSVTSDVNILEVLSPSFIVLPPAGLAEGEELRPIKPIIKEEISWRDFIHYLYALLGVLALGGLIYWLLRKPSEEVEVVVAPPPPPPPAHVTALEALQSLKQAELWQRGEIKAYQSELTHIIRQYLEDRFGIQALEMTTDEIARALASTSFDKKQESKMREILQMADLIKFAKARPDVSLHDQYMQDAEAFVRATRAVAQSEGSDD